MRDRWRGRAAGPAAGLLLLAVGALVATGVAASRPPNVQPRLVVIASDGTRLAEMPLRGEGRLTLRYRNSVYRSLAEERFVITSSGELSLEGLAADELAVLDEYYGALDTVPAPAGDARRYVGAPAYAVVLDELTLAATDLGQRTLLLPGERPLELWQLVTDADPSVTLRVERAGP